MKQPALIRRAGAEMFGAYALVAAGCWAIAVDSLTGSLGHVGVAITFGLVVAVMVAGTGHLSGAHLNPAVTVAFALTRHFPWREVPVYILFQIVGAIRFCLAVAAAGDIAHCSVDVRHNRRRN